MHLKTIVVFVNLIVDFSFNHSFRNFNYCVFNKLFHNTAFEYTVSFCFFSCFNFFFKILFVVCNCVELTNVFNEFIVVFRKFFFHNFIKFNFEYCRFASKLFSTVSFWESNVNVKFVACFLANNLVFKTINKLTWTEFKVVIFTFTAFKCFTIHKAFEVDNSCIAFFSCSVFNSNHFSISFECSINSIFNFWFFNWNFFFFSCETFIFFNFCWRLNNYLKLYCEAVFIERNDFIIKRSSNWNNTCFFCSRIKKLWVFCINCIVPENFFTIVSFNNVFWSFTFTEARYIISTLVFVVSVRNCFFEFFALKWNFKSVNVCFCLFARL